MATMYFIENENKKVLITIDKSKYNYQMIYPLRHRAFVSDLFQWLLIEAYIYESWSISIDEESKRIWESRPSTFDKRSYKILYQVKNVDCEVFDVVNELDDEICILQEFDYANWPPKRTLEIWQSKNSYEKI